MADILESLLRGGAQGATADFGDEGSAKVYGALNNLLGGPKDPEGIGREYAAGSPEQDYLQGERRDNSAAAKAHPLAYGAGSVLGALPATMAVPAGGGGSAAARVAASGLTGGALGALTGAGSANGQDMARSAAKGAGLGGALGVGGASAVEAIPMLRQVFANLPKTAEASATGTVAESGAVNGLPQHKVQINYSVDKPAMLPPKGSSNPSSGSWSMPEIPKAGKPGFRPSQIPAAEAEAQAADNFTSAANKRMIEKSMRNPPKNIDRDVEYMKNMADQKEAGVARRAATDELPATVRPPKKGDRAPAPKPEPASIDQLPVGEDVMYNSVLRQQDPAKYFASDPSHSATYVPYAKARFEDAYNMDAPVEGFMRASKLKPDARIAGPEELLAEYEKQLGAGSSARIKDRPWIATHDDGVLDALRQKYDAVRVGNDPVPHTDQKVFSTTTYPLRDDILEMLGEYPVRVTPNARGSVDPTHFSILPKKK